MWEHYQVQGLTWIKKKKVQVPMWENCQVQAPNSGLTILSFSSPCSVSLMVVYRGWSREFFLEGLEVNFKCLRRLKWNFTIVLIYIHTISKGAPKQLYHFFKEGGGARSQPIPSSSDTMVYMVEESVQGWKMSRKHLWAIETNNL